MTARLGDTVLIAILLAKLFSVVTIVLGITTGVLSRAWWQLAIGSVAVAAVQEAVLSATQPTRQFNPVVFLVGIAAAAAWASVAFAVKAQMQKQKNQNSN